jgi:hypothetical protein
MRGLCHPGQGGEADASRDLSIDESLDDPGSAAHRFALRRVRDDNEE